MPKKKGKHVFSNLNFKCNLQHEILLPAWIIPLDLDGGRFDIL